MVQRQIRGRGVKNPRVLDAMSRVPRELFLPVHLREHAYEDRAMTIGCDQTISQPFMVASMTEHLDVAAEHRVLEVGTGSGYQCAILAMLAQEVYTVERITELRDQATVRLSQLGFDNVAYHVGDGTLGWPEHAPYDRILVTAGAPVIPQALIDQLIDGGRLVIPVGQLEQQTLTVLEKRDGRVVEMPAFQCRFVKLIGDQGWSDRS